mmetsp:Transcript_31177/g.93488  ORF Transcript_31177/g.93488 Transcript_31177/m.93488 type:complete len:88 (+) Transcript_31177:30-293(+)
MAAVGEVLGQPARRRGARACRSPDDGGGGAAELVDGDHHLVLAEVIDAYVRSSYWDADKMRFRPATPETPPYLTFLGSQAFGYVRSD